MRFRKIAAALLTLALGFCLCQSRAAFAALRLTSIHSCRSFRFPFSPQGKHLSQRKH